MIEELATTIGARLVIAVLVGLSALCFIALFGKPREEGEQ